jgi:hypothetical protein
MFPKRGNGPNLLFQMNHVGDRQANEHFWTGHVVFMKFAEGSKSESMRPFIVTPHETLRLHVKGDNPFDNQSLKAYHLKFCTIHGVLTDGRLVEVRSITPMIDLMNPPNGEEHNKNI